jgi:outer membrane protein TolC
MNLIKKSAIAFFMVLIVLNLKAEAPDTLTLDYCHKLAVEYYPLARQKQLLTESTGLKNDNADKNYLPQFDVNGRATYQSDVTKVPISFPGVSIPTPDNEVYDLYKVKERVNGLFYKILLFKTNKEALLINRQNVVEKLKELTSGIENGMVLQSNGDVLEAQILQIDQSIIELDAETGATYKMLGEMLGIEIPVSTFLLLPNPVIETTTYINQRPEYLLLDLQKNKLEISKSLITAANRPKFSGFGKLGYGKPGLNMLSTEFDSYYMVGVGLSWDIINWNKPKNQKKLLDLQQGIVETQKEALDLNVKIQVDDDLAQIEKFNALIVNDENLIILREKITKTASSQLDNGIITSTQYLDELNKATRARLDLETHRIQLSFAKINYLKTIGKL